MHRCWMNAACNGSGAAAGLHVLSVMGVFPLDSAMRKNSSTCVTLYQFI